MKEYRIFGPPGCGKTTRLSKQIVRAVKKYGSDKIIVASFTRAAAVTLIRRGLPIDRKQIGTLHAHCYRALGGVDLADSHLAEWNTENPQYLMRGGADSSIDNPWGDGNSYYEGDRLYGKTQILRAKMAPANAWPMAERAFFEQWKAWKLDFHYFDFTDLLEQALETVIVAPGEPAVGFFDEAQDFTTLELKIVRQWGSHMEHFVIAGDPNQCIYGFKGASPEAFLSPEIPKEQKYFLTQSYRMPKAVHVFTEKWISQVKITEDRQFFPVEREGLVLDSFISWENPIAVRHEVEKYVADKKSVMILTSCSYMLKPIIQALREVGLPFWNSFREKRRDWNPLSHGNMSDLITTAERISRFLKPDFRSWGDKAEMWSIYDLSIFIDLIKSADNLVYGGKSFAKNLPNEVEGRFEPSEKDLAEIFKPGVVDEILLGERGMIGWLREHAVPSKEEKLDFPLLVVEKLGAKALFDDPLVTVGTIHSVKGGEADVVFLFPDVSRLGKMEWDHPDGRDAVIRQFYVGMTRAKEILVLCRPENELHVVW